MVSHSGLITVMDARRAQGGAAPSPRLRRGRAAAGQPQGAGRLRVDGRQARRADDRRGTAQCAARLGHAAGRRRRDRGQPRQAALDRRPARRHDQLPPRHSAFLDLDRGRGKEARRRHGDHAGPGLSAADRRELLGGKGQGRLASRCAAAGVRSPRPCRQRDRHRHSLPWARQSRAMGEDLHCGRVRKSRGSAASAPPRSTSPGSPPAAWMASGRTTSTCGTRPPACFWFGRRAASSPTIAAPTARSNAANMSPGPRPSTASCKSSIAGALAIAVQRLRPQLAVLKRRQVFEPRSFPLASVAAGYLPILLFLIIALGLSSAFVVLPMIVSRFTGAHQPDPQKLVRI